MIDAVTFATSYNAFWHTTTPTCEHFVRRLNLDGVDRFQPPMEQSNTSKRRALIAEYAFSLFVETKTSRSADASLASAVDIEDAAWRAAELRLMQYVREGLDLTRKFDEGEKREVDEIFRSLLVFFSTQDRVLVLRPMFSGCGFVDASEGDVIQGRTIYEVKSVDRLFRSNDVRQVLTYAALNFASRQYAINRVGLFNPRRGVYCDLDLSAVCPEISGRSAAELLAVIVDAMSGGGISR